MLIQNFLFHLVLHVGEVKISASVSPRTGGRSMFYKHLLFTTKAQHFYSGQYESNDLPRPRRSALSECF